MTSDDVRELMRAAIAKAGSQKAWAEKINISQTYISDILAGNREPAAIVLSALGLERETVYWRTK